MKQEEMAAFSKEFEKAFNGEGPELFIALIKKYDAIPIKKKEIYKYKKTDRFTVIVIKGYPNLTFAIPVKGDEKTGVREIVFSPIRI
jgi:hypothetical protein